MAFTAAIASPQTLFTLDPEHRIVEGVASDGATVWVSSVLDREIIACRSTCSRFATLEKGLHPFAMAWDRSRNRLWIAADCPPGVVGIKPCERGAILALDLSGRVRSRTALSSGSFHPGDVSASAAGVFVSDSQNGAVYAVSKDGRDLVTVIKAGVGTSGQGTAIGPDRKHLIVSDYSQGVGVVDLKTRSRTLLISENGKPLRGIDGIARCGGVYYAIDNGSAPGSLVAMSLVGAQPKLNYSLSVARLSDPTQVAYDGKRLLIVDNSGWASLEKSPSTRSDGAKVVAITLGSDCKPR